MTLQELLSLMEEYKNLLKTPVKPLPSLFGLSKEHADLIIESHEAEKAIRLQKLRDLENTEISNNKGDK